MACDGCGAQNREDASFCASCGAPLARRCPACAREVAADARFCDGCGTPIADTGPAPAAVRKTVTAVFCDLRGSTGFGERVDAETARAVIGRYHAMLQEVVDAHAGTVAKFIGDGMLAFFGLPKVAEDDAQRAVATAAEMQRRFASFADEVASAHGERLRLRIGVNSGEVVIGEGDADVIGDALNVAARLEKACEPGRVLVGEATWRLTRSAFGYEPVGDVSVGGRAEPVPAFVLAEEARPDEQATPFVGRDGELSRLRSALAESVAERAARFVAVIGPPGVGKTRLSRELELAVGDEARVLHTACERAGGSTFAPLVDLIRPAMGEATDRAALAALVPPGEDERERVVAGLAGVVGLAEARSTEETFWAVRRMVELLAADLPLVLVIDDIQWAEARLLDLLEHLTEWVADAPVLLVGLARPELRDLRPVLAQPGRRVADVVVLDGLDAGATAQLATRILGGGELPAELVARLPDSTDGNPLFVRELARMLVDEGVIRREGDDWRLTVDVDAVEVPPTIRSLLAARIERLPPDERTVLERASVVGPDFVLGALRDLVADEQHLDAQLEALRRRDLVEPTGAYWGDEPVWRFHHVLIRDAVYGRLLKETRAELHERVGDWTAAAAPHVVGDHEAAIAHHYEQAHGYRSQLGALDDHGRELGRRAADLLTAAARRSLAADDLVATGSLAVRALACLQEDEGADLALLALEALLASGELTEVPRLLDAVADEAWADVYRAQWLDLTAPDRLDEAERLADTAASTFARRNDRSGQAKAHLVRAGLLARRGRLADSEVELDRAMGAARDAGDNRRLVAALGAAPTVALWGPSPVARAGGRCLDVIRLLRITTASPVVEATSLRHQAVLESLRGRVDPARRLLGHVRSTVEELGLRRDLMEVELFTGLVELLDGDPTAAEPHLRTAHDGLAALGAAAAAGAAAVLARALVAQGRLDEAEALDGGTSDQDLKTAITWRSVRAELLAARGETGPSVALAEEAVALAEGTDLLLDHADALATLATVRRAAGDTVGAEVAAAEAQRRYEEKGSTVHGPEVAAGAGLVSTATDNAAVRFYRQIYAHWQAVGPDVVERYAPDYRAVDRRAGLGHEAVGREAIVEHLQTIDELLGPATLEVSEVRAQRGDRLALLLQRVRGGYEIEWLVLVELAEDGRQRQTTLYDVDDESSAMAELEARHRELTSENAAARFNRDLFRRWMDEGPDAIAELYTPDFRSVDRRPGLGHEIVGREAMAEQLRVTSALMGDSRVDMYEIVAQRGEGLVLFRQAVTGAFEVEMLCLAEVDEGQQARVVMFDVNDRAVALAELDRWHAEGLFAPGDLSEPLAELDRRHRALKPLNRAARHNREVLERWMSEGPDAVMDRYSPSCRLVDRRQGLGTEVVGREARLRHLQVTSDLLDGALFEPLEVMGQRGDRLALVREGVTNQTFSVEILVLVELDESGLETLAMLYDVDDLGGAMAELDRRHAQITGEAGRTNRAAELAATLVSRWMVEGADAVADLIAEDVHFEDRRVGLGSVLDGKEGHLANLRAVEELLGDSRFQHQEVVAVRGDRLVLARQAVVGPTEIELLALAEFDDQGRQSLAIIFDVDDEPAAVEELNRRYVELMADG